MGFFRKGSMFRRSILLIIQDSWNSSNISSHFIKSFPHPYFLRQASKKGLKESKAFSTVTI